jgi:Flp pilus assembly protein TadB
LRNKAAAPHTRARVGEGLNSFGIKEDRQSGGQGPGAHAILILIFILLLILFLNLNLIFLLIFLFFEDCRRWRYMEARKRMILVFPAFLIITFAALG